MPQNLRNADDRGKGQSRKISSGSRQKSSELKHQYTATFKFERVTPEMLAEIRKNGGVSSDVKRKAPHPGENLLLEALNIDFKMKSVPAKKIRKSR